MGLIEKGLILFNQAWPLPTSRMVVFPDGREGEIHVEDLGETVEITTFYPSGFHSKSEVITVRTKSEKGSRPYNRLKIPGAREAVKTAVKTEIERIQNPSERVTHEAGMRPLGTMLPDRYPPTPRRREQTRPRGRG